MSLEKPLEGKCILITRPLGQSQKLAEQIASCGARALELPLITISPPDSWKRFDSAFHHLEKYRWIIFASVNAVQTTMQRLEELGLKTCLSRLQIACIGPSTAAEIKTHGLDIALLPESFVAESLLKAFPEAKEQGDCVLWPRTNIGRDLLKDGLAQKGWQVEVVNSYKTEGPKDPASAALKLKSWLAGEQIYAITLSSSETAKQLKKLLLIAANGDEKQAAKLLSMTKLAVIGPETAKTCLSLFGRVDAQAESFNTQGLLQSIKDLERQKAD